MYNQSDNKNLESCLDTWRMYSIGGSDSVVADGGINAETISQSIYRKRIRNYGGNQLIIYVYFEKQCKGCFIKSISNIKVCGFSLSCKVVNW